MAVYRVGNDEGTVWWVADRTNFDDYPTFDALPDDIKGRVAMLRAAPNGFSEPNLGRRISDQRFWVYIDGDQSDGYEQD